MARTPSQRPVSIAYFFPIGPMLPYPPSSHESHSIASSSPICVAIVMAFESDNSTGSVPASISDKSVAASFAICVLSMRVTYFCRGESLPKLPPNGLAQGGTPGHGLQPPLEFQRKLPSLGCGGNYSKRFS
jgi:hypothetical protein